jgi:hypothetical protein
MVQQTSKADSFTPTKLGVEFNDPWKAGFSA